MVRNLVIVGAGHLALDVYGLINNINRGGKTWNVTGFLSDVEVDLAKEGIEEPILGPIHGWDPRADEEYVLAIGNVLAKEKIAEEMKAKGAKFATLISRTASVNVTASIGEGSMITGNSQIGRKVSIGRFCIIGDSTMAPHSSIGDYSNTASYANIYQDISVGSHVQIWSHAVILKDVEDYAVVGAGSVVVKKVKSGTKVFGCPAKKIAF